MSEPKHTPGPWKLGHEDYAYFEYGKETIKHSCVGIDADGDVDLARIVIGDPHGTGIANAELIARAPSLLAENERLRGVQSECEKVLEQGRKLTLMLNAENAVLSKTLLERTAQNERLREALSGLLSWFDKADEMLGPCPPEEEWPEVNAARSALSATERSGK